MKSTARVKGLMALHTAIATEHGFNVKVGYLGCNDYEGLYNLKQGWIDDALLDAYIKADGYEEITLYALENGDYRLEQLYFPPKEDDDGKLMGGFTRMELYYDRNDTGELEDLAIEAFIHGHFTIVEAIGIFHVAVSMFKSRISTNHMPYLTKP